MKRINFKKLEVETQIEVFEIKDLTKDIGNGLHAKATDIGMDELARKIYHSDREVEISDQEFSSMMQLIQGVFYFPIYDAITKNAIDVPNTEMRIEKCI